MLEKLSLPKDGSQDTTVETEAVNTQARPLPRLAYSAHETAQVLGLSYETVHRLIKRGQLKSSTALRHKLIPVTEIERFLKSTLK